MTFTFISEREGSTFIEQFSGKDLGEAVSNWYKESVIEPDDPLELEGEEPTPVDTVKNVWCIAGHDAEGRFFWLHIVATAA